MKVERSRIVWEPRPEEAAESQLGRFAALKGFGIDEYDSLHRWALSDLVQFWSDVWDFMGLIGCKGSIGAIQSHEMGKRHFFPDATINVAENILRHDPNSIAVIQVDASGEVQSRVSFLDLKTQVDSLAGWMAARGIKERDVVATISTNRLEALVTMLATAALGATWTAVSPDLSARAIIDRFQQVEPALLFSPLEYTYNSTNYNFSKALLEVEAEIGSVTNIVLIGNESSLDHTIPVRSHVTLWREALDAQPIKSYQRFPFNTPFLILYTSGTTGKPKAIVHSSGGVLLRTGAEHRFHTNVKSGDIFFQYTSVSWMMFPWTMMSLETGAAVVLYEDAAVKKHDGEIDVGPVWRIAENAQATVLGISPNLLRIIQRENYSPKRKHDVSKLKTMLFTGAPMPAGLYDWILENVAKMRINSISGGTEAMGAFVLGSPIHAVRAGEMSCNSLGIAVDVLDDRGVSVSGSPGELVITQPFPSMPLTFWGPDGDEKYRSAYFETFPNVWTHGDLSERTINGGFVIHGRSDNTLKPGGVRLGSSDIYTAIEELHEIEDCIIVGRPVDGDEEVILCVQLGSGQILSERFAAKIRTTIRTKTSPRHVPACIYQVSDVPKTLTGKRVEAAVKAAILNKDVSKFVSLVNPDSLQQYSKLSQSKYY